MHGTAVKCGARECCLACAAACLRVSLANVQHCSCLHCLSAIFCACLPACLRVCVVAWCQDAGGTDRPLDPSLLQLVTYLCPNELELQALTGSSTQTHAEVTVLTRTLTGSAVTDTECCTPGHPALSWNRCCELVADNQLAQGAWLSSRFLA